MVQVIQKGPSLGSLSGQMLGQSFGQTLGEGLGNTVSAYYINKALDSVTNDPELKDAPLSQRWEAAQRKLRPFGPAGEKALQQRILMEQQQEQEKEKIKQENLMKKKGNALGRYLNGEKLTEDENAMFTPQEFVAMHKARNPKPPGGVTAQPLTPEIQTAIKDIINDPEYKKMSADQAEVRFMEMNVPQSAYNGLIESKRREEETTAKIGQKQAEETRAYNTRIAEPFIKEANETIHKMPLRKASFAQLSENMSDTGIADFIADVTGFEPLRSKSGAVAKSGLKDFFISSLSRAGSRPNQWIEQQLMGALPTFGRSAESNETIERYMQEQMELDEIRARKILELEQEDIKKYGGPKSDIVSRADEAIKPLIEENNKKVAYDLRVIAEDHSDLNELLRMKQVPEGTPLTLGMARLLLDKHNGDKEKADKEAKMRGFTIYPPEFYQGKSR